MFCNVLSSFWKSLLLLFSIFSLFSGFNFITILAEIEKNEIDGACNAYGGEERRIQGFGGEN